MEKKEEQHNTEIGNINNKNTEQDKEIEELQKENIELRKDINSFPSNIVNGRNITITDAMEKRVKKLGVFGKCTQETRSGKNKLNLANKNNQSYCTVEITDKGIHVIPTSSSNNPSVTINCELNAGSHYIHLDKATTSMNIAFCDENNNKVHGTSSNISASGKYTFTGKAVKMLINSLYSDGEYTLNYEKLYVNEGTTDLGYEKYGVAPSPEHLSEIKEVGGDIEVAKAKHNILKPTWAQDLLDRLNVSSTDTNNCITEIDGYRYFKYAASLGDKTNLRYFAKDCFKPNTQYTFKTVLMLTTTGEVYPNFIITYSDGNTELKSITMNTAMKRADYKITSKAGKTINDIRIYWSGGATYIDLDKTMLYEGTEDLEWEEYAEVNKFTLTEGQTLCGLKTTDKTKANYIDENGQAWISDYLAEDGIHKRIIKNIFDGSNDEGWRIWTFGGDVLERFYIVSDNIFPRGSLVSSLCSHFKYMRDNQNESHYRFGGENLNEFLVHINKTVASTLEEFKAWLASNPITLTCELAEEKIIPYTEEQKAQYKALQNIRMYKDSTNIYAGDELTNLQVEYTKDISSLESRIKALEDKIGGA